MTTFATIDPAAATYALHATEADATAAADAQDALFVLIAEDLEGLTIKQGAALFAATAAPLGIAPVKRFPDRATAARRIWQNLAALSATAPEAATPKAKPAAKAKAPRKSRGINLAPKAEAKPCRVGTKQAVLVDLLSRPTGATMNELIDALGNWKPITVKSGLTWDMNAVKGYGIRTEHLTGFEAFVECHLDDCGTFGTALDRAGVTSQHPDDHSDHDALLALAHEHGYDQSERIAVYHLVLPVGMDAPLPHTQSAKPKAEAGQ
ncbi:DUF3489 domain-containing protein [Roseibacterium beibuensis]|uniref:Uncharacterized protein n=1 Tax=[Roseibacterium] beibuensis TaxID=1193142 RepID=A0ABP9LEG2_9RHOB|nr:DUF3489 domain-containing protein [Roseibacterium beibuensis]MCS6623665.1 DUF3489 domain-containing protein [Roseibacterium beibuensis]